MHVELIESYALPRIFHAAVIILLSSQGLDGNISFMEVQQTMYEHTYQVTHLVWVRPTFLQQTWLTSTCINT